MSHRSLKKFFFKVEVICENVFNWWTMKSKLDDKESRESKRSHGLHWGGRLDYQSGHGGSRWKSKLYLT